MSLDKSDAHAYTNEAFAKSCRDAPATVKELAVARTLVTDLSPALRFQCLESLTATKCRIEFIAALPATLRHAMLSGCLVSDLRFLKSVPLMKTLYLENNRVASLTQLSHLRHCPALERLWLCGNPVCADPGYVGTLKGCLNGKTLQNLDRKVLSEAQRKEYVLSAFMQPAPAPAPAPQPPAEGAAPLAALQAQLARVEAALEGQAAKTAALDAKLDRVLALLAKDQPAQ